MKTIALAFLFLFTAFLATPTVVTLIKQDADVSYVFNLTEEEENSNSGKESKKSFENLWKFFSSADELLVFMNGLKKRIDHYYFKNVKAIYHELLSPPPELA